MHGRLDRNEPNAGCCESDVSHVSCAQVYPHVCTSVQAVVFTWMLGHDTFQIFVSAC